MAGGVGQVHVSKAPFQWGPRFSISPLKALSASTATECNWIRVLALHCWGKRGGVLLQPSAVSNVCLKGTILAQYHIRLQACLSRLY